MKTIFTNKEGENYTPNYFSVIHFKNGTTKSLPFMVEHQYVEDYYSQRGVYRVSIYDNRGSNPEEIDRLQYPNFV